jgi:hypothetical protein
VGANGTCAQSTVDDAIVQMEFSAECDDGNDVNFDGGVHCHVGGLPQL